MELLLVFLSTAVGTVVGVAAAMLMMSRRNRMPAVGDAAVRTQLQNTEWALASAARDVEDLRKQLVERDGASDELRRAKQQLAAAEQRATELAEQIAALPAKLDEGAASTAQTAELQSALAAAEQRAAELAGEVAAMRPKLEASELSAQRATELEAALAAAEQRAWDGAEQAAHETARHRAEIEAASAAAHELAASMSEEITGLTAALASAEQRWTDAAAESASLRERLEQITEERRAAGLGVEESTRRIASLEAEVAELSDKAAAERERHRVAALEAAQFEGLLRKERQASMEAMELLSRAQDKFAEASAAGSSDVAHARLHPATDAIDLLQFANGHS
jgi:chromosome segregation ATPase